MARPLRFEVENGWRHVTARGNERPLAKLMAHALRLLNAPRPLHES
jgi:hypothetical protein